MAFWQTFWTVLCVLGFAGFFIMFLAVVPLGALQLKELFAHLDSERDTVHAPAENAGGNPADSEVEA
jgi:hypothetical protein